MAQKAEQMRRTVVVYEDELDNIKRIVADVTPQVRKAADEIERLRTENAALRAESREPSASDARLGAFLDELHRLMPAVHCPIMSDPPEPKYIAAIEELLKRQTEANRLLSERHNYR